MKAKYSRFRHNAKQTRFTPPTGPRRQDGEHEHAQYPRNDDVTAGWSCRRPENVSILSSLMSRWRRQQERQKSNAAYFTLFYILYFFAATARPQREIT